MTILKIILSASLFFTQILSIVFEFEFDAFPPLKNDKPFTKISLVFNTFSKSDWAKNVPEILRSNTIIKFFIYNVAFDLIETMKWRLIAQ